DSILSLQITAKANRAGLRITPKQIFDYPTIAQLASCAGLGREHDEDEHQRAPGEQVPLTPIQHWFFERQLIDPHHFNQAVMLEVPPDCSRELLAPVIARLIEHHQALRLCFVRQQSGWRQQEAEPAWRAPLAQFDLSLVDPSDQARLMTAVAAQQQTGLDLAEGPLLRAGLFHLGAGRSSRLLLVIHHLVVDGVSWRILLEDLQSGYEQARRGQALELPARTSSFARWAERVSEHADSQQVKKELSYWLEVVGGPMAHLPVEQTGGANTVESGRSIEVKLGEAETQALLQEAPRVYRAQVNEVLVTALGQALVEWCGGERVVIDLEGHGREEIGRGVDVSRTVGWFTTIYPVALKIELGSDVIDALKTVKEQLRVVPERGLGYGLLRYVSREVSASARGKLASPAEVSFNYLGQFDQTLNESAAFKLSPESSGQTSGSAGLRHYLLKINGAVINRCLRLTF